MAKKKIQSDNETATDVQEPEQDNATEVAATDIAVEETLAPASVVEATTDIPGEEEIELKKGQVYVMANNPDGTEKPGSGFITYEKDWERTYSKQTFGGVHPKFTLKKKSQ